MFNSLANSFHNLFTGISGKSLLSESDVDEALRQVRRALLEADVGLPIVQDFIKKIKQDIVGKEVNKSLSPSKVVLKIVHDNLVNLLGPEDPKLNLEAGNTIMLVGLQGVGKTTFAAKLAKKLSKDNNILLASADTRRPAAQKQLQLLAEQAGVDFLPMVEDQSALDIAKRATDRNNGVLVLDTAGRTHVDDELMQELVDIKIAINPREIFLVADVMMGQDAVNLAQTFHERLTITGIVFTRCDSDSKSGVILSIKAVTQCPIQFLSAGEKLDEVEYFHADRIAGRILNMGDMASFAEKASEIIDKNEADNLTEKVKKGKFDFDDLMGQLRTIEKLGGMAGMLNFIPGFNKMSKRIPVGKGNFKRHIAIISSMTKKERQNPQIINGSRKKRIARGAGVGISDVNILLKQFKQMSAVVKKIGKIPEDKLKGLDMLKNFN